MNAEDYAIVVGIARYPELGEAGTALDLQGSEQRRRRRGGLADRPGRRTPATRRPAEHPARTKHPGHQVLRVHGPDLGRRRPADDHRAREGDRKPGPDCADQQGRGEGPAGRPAALHLHVRARLLARPRARLPLHGECPRAGRPQRPRVGLAGMAAGRGLLPRVRAVDGLLHEPHVLPAATRPAAAAW